MGVLDDIESAADEVYSILGAGHTESVYHRALERELSEQGISFSSEGTIPIFYKGSPVGRRRPDLFVDSDDGTVIIELKAGSNSGKEQLLSYIDILTNDKNYDIYGGILVQFNDTIEVEKIS